MPTLISYLSIGKSVGTEYRTHTCTVYTQSIIIFIVVVVVGLVRKKKATSPVLSVCLAKFPTLIILPTTTHLLIKLIYLPLTTHVGPQQLRRSQTVYIYIYVCLHLRSRVLDQLVLSLSKGKVIYLYTDNHACFLIFYSIFFYFIRIGLVSGSSLNRWEAAARDVRPMINE